MKEEKKHRGVFERPKGSGIYWTRYVDSNGRLRREKAGTKSAAILLYRKRKQEALEGVKLPEKLKNLARPTLREFGKKFLKAIEIRCAQKPRTVKFYEEQLQRLLEHEPLANARLDDIDEALIENYVQHRSGDFVRYRTKDGTKRSTNRRVSPATVNRALATLRRLLRLAQEWREIERMPRIRLIAGERNREYILSYEEETAYLGFVSQPLNDIATLVLDTGLRIGEALGLEWKDVQLAAGGPQWGYLEVRDGKSRNAKRAVPLTRRVHQMLTRRRLASRAPSVFAEGESVMRVSSLDHMHAQTRKSLNLPAEFVLHSLRHTYLTRLGLSGADAFTMMKLAGHGSVVVSQRYVHPTPQAMQDAVARLDNMNLRSLELNAMSSEPGISTQSAAKQGLPVQNSTGTRTGTTQPSVSVSH